LEKFIDQQTELLDLLQQAYNVDLIKVKTKTSISKFIKLRLGDTLQFVVFHNQRHILQAKEIVKNK
ncbi:MAG: DinB family protein, partial [Bacteroidota bacterium]|nr:DinB family protein [Bacteroidota bacterium]